MADGSIKSSISYGKTADWGYNIVENGCHDLNATILHLMGFDHERLTYRFQGRNYRSTDVHGQVVKNIWR
jgi:hypothetical protein